MYVKQDSQLEAFCSMGMRNREGRAFVGPRELPEVEILEARDEVKSILKHQQGVYIHVVTPDRTANSQPKAWQTTEYLARQ